MKRVGPTSLPLQYRTIEGAITRVAAADGADAEQPQYEISFSSEQPVQRWYGKETLSHTRSAVDMRYLQKGGAVLFDHAGDPIGVMDKAWVDEAARKVRATVRFSRSARAQEIRQDVDDGIITRSSIGYAINRWRLDKQGDVEGDNEWTATRWMPYEGSLVGIPADLSVGVGRSAKSSGGAEFPIEFEGGEPAEEVRSMKCNICQQDSCAHSPEQRAAAANGTTDTRSGAQGAAAPAQAATAVADPPAGGERAAGSAPSITGGESREQQTIEIARLGERHGMTDKIAGWLQRRMTPQQVSNEILEGMTTKALAQPGSERAVELSEKDARSFSYRKAILEAADNKGEITGLEREVSDEIAKRLPTEYKRRGGFFVPTRLRAPSAESIDRRTMAGNVAGAGPELVGVERGEFVELLRNRAVL